ncbi:hypothetical protein OG21DRAFT_861968 [Imleria badia]|nr:hypothetical protein OG21DRAFT_861968 [Imleria badia]
MDNSHPLIHRRTHRVMGPRPCSWISSSSDSSLSSSEHLDVWPRTIRGRRLRRESTLRSTTSTESSDSSISSSSSSPVHTPNILLECGDNPYYHHARKRKPAGPRAPRNSSCFDVRPRLVIRTSSPVIPQLQRKNSPTTPPVQSADVLESSQLPPFAINSPTNFLLDWDAIFEILECSDAFPDSTELDS